MYRAINKKFLKDIKTIVNRHLKGITLVKSEDKIEYTHSHYCKSSNKCIDAEHLQATEATIEYFSRNFNSLNKEEQKINSLGISKLAGIFTPLIIGNENCSAYKLFKSIGLYDDFIDPNGGYYSTCLYSVITHFLPTGWDRYSIDTYIAWDINYINIKIPDDKATQKFCSQFIFDFKQICTIDNKTKKLNIDGFYKKYDSDGLYDQCYP
jgi:hypothetical protein